MTDNFILNIESTLENIRNKCPVIHNITNYVTVNDCANITIAIGASPIMSDDIDEVSEIVSLSSALVLNIGTLNKRTIQSMILAGKTANEKNIPIILDPVGAGASQLRNNTAKELVETLKIAVIRGNLSEISFLAGLGYSTKGVDVSKDDIENSDAAFVSKSVSKKYNCVSVITGETDYISYNDKIVCLKNGHRMLSSVTGTGCMTTSLIGAFCGANSDYFISAIAGTASMGIAGEISYAENSGKGTGSFHIGIIDAVSRLNGNILSKRVKINEI